MTRSEWYLKAEKFHVGVFKLGRNELPKNVWIEMRRNTPVMWAIINDSGEVLNKSFHWEWEPNPSSRTDEFINRTRYTLDEAQSICERIFNLPG